MLYYTLNKIIDINMYRSSMFCIDSIDAKHRNLYIISTLKRSITLRGK